MASPTTASRSESPEATAAGSGAGDAPAPRGSGGRTLWVGAAIAAWGVVLLIGGVAHGEQPWAMAAFGAGIACVGVSLLAWLARRPAAAMAGAVAATALGAVAAGWLIGDAATTRLGVLGLMMLGIAGIIAQAVSGLSGADADATAGRRAGAGATAAAPGHIQLSPDLEAVLRRIDEHAMLSDNARRVLFRERELALLDQAIEEDIRDGRFDVALTLVDELADVFGERERAESYRDRILLDRRQHHEAGLRTMMLELDGFLGHRQWRSAQEVADRIRRTRPEPDVATDIDRRFLTARAMHKADLEATFLATVERGETEDAMRVLRELDHYLTADEAGRFRELAGGVIKQHRENLGVQFKLAVNDHRWPEAVSIGETIIAEFPNTKMAVEVRSMIDLLRGRASAGPAGESGESLGRMVAGPAADSITPAAAAPGRTAAPATAPESEPRP
jgi:hypothetical protein